MNFCFHSNNASLEVKISNDAKFKADEVKGTYNLTVKDISLKDSCTFVCIARNKVGESRSECKLGICVPPKFLKAPEAAPECELGKEFRTVCVLRGLPLPDLRLKDLTGDSGQEPFTLLRTPISDTEVEYALTLGALTDATPLNFDVIGVNSVGEVKSKLDIRLLRPPVFATKPDDVISLSVGKDVLLEVAVTASPAATISWYVCLRIERWRLIFFMCFILHFFVCYKVARIGIVVVV